jgi:hypothetical protein
METITTTIPAPDRAETIFDVVVEVAYGFTDPLSIHREELKVEGHGLQTGVSSAQLPYRVKVIPTGELASEILLEIDIEDASTRQTQAKDLLINVFNEQTPREYARRRAGSPTIRADNPQVAQSMFDRWSPIEVAEFFRYASIPVLIFGCIVLIITMIIFASTNPIARPSAWVVVLTLGGEIFGTVMASAILLYFGYALKLLSTTRDALITPTTSESSIQS